MKYRLDNTSHAVYSIQFHYVCCTKYRREVITKEISDRLKEITLTIAKSFGVTIIEQETDKDHIHILFESKPQLQVSKFVNSLKSTSSRYIRKEFPDIKNQLWGDAFWSRSYFLASTGQVTLDAVKSYVQSQGKED
jgi:putative transposase